MERKPESDNTVSAEPPTPSSERELEGQQTKKVLCVGLVCVDIVKIVSHFPEEDSDMRAVECIWKKGGNAANTATVISILGAPSEFLGTIAKDPFLQFLQSDFEDSNVVMKQCPIVEGMTCPVSIVITSQETGSRTIIHTNQRSQELTLNDFSKLAPTGEHYSWIHFEGRPNYEQIYQMLLYVAKHNDDMKARKEEDRIIRTSIEIEKPAYIGHLIPLMQHADYVFISKEAATNHGFHDPQSAVEGMIGLCKPGGTVICPWGDKGAAGKTNEDGAQLQASLAFPPEKLLDTLGAGDTFNGAVIYATIVGIKLQYALTFACQVAGAKCGMIGFKGLADLLKKIPEASEGP